MVVIWNIVKLGVDIIIVVVGVVYGGTRREVHVCGRKR